MRPFQMCGTTATRLPDHDIGWSTLDYKLRPGERTSTTGSSTRRATDWRGRGGDRMSLSCRGSNARSKGYLRTMPKAMHPKRQPCLMSNRYATSTTLKVSSNSIVMSAPALVPVAADLHSLESLLRRFLFQLLPAQCTTLFLQTHHTYGPR